MESPETIKGIGKSPETRDEGGYEALIQKRRGDAGQKMGGRAGRKGYLTCLY